MRLGDSLPRCYGYRRSGATTGGSARTPVTPRGLERLPGVDGEVAAPAPPTSVFAATIPSLRATYGSRSASQPRVRSQRRAVPAHTLFKLRLTSRPRCSGSSDGEASSNRTPSNADVSTRHLEAASFALCPTFRGTRYPRGGGTTPEGGLNAFSTSWPRDRLANRRRRAARHRRGECTPRSCPR